MSSQQRAINKRRESAEHQAKRERIAAQIASGELTIRKATAAERRRWQQEREQRSGSTMNTADESGATL